jgi:hypothetical protein
MINLSHETEILAVRLAAAQRLSVEAAIRQALEAQARATGSIPGSRGRAACADRSIRGGARFYADP